MDKLKESGVFILCIHCIRTVLILVASDSKFARFLSPMSGFSFAVGVCRTCVDFDSVVEETYSVPYRIIQNTHMYWCACMVAKEELPIAEEQNKFVDIALNDPDFMNSDCQIYGVQTDEEILSKLELWGGDKLLLNHVPKGFF